MNKLAHLLILLPILILGGCVVPLSHDIYKPFYEGGELVDSDVCGYLFNNKDTLKIDTIDYSARIRLSSYDNKSSELFIQIIPKNKEQWSWNPSLLEMVFQGEIVQPFKVTRHEYGKAFAEGTKDVIGHDVLAEKYFYIIEFNKSLSDGGTSKLLLLNSEIEGGGKTIEVGDIIFTKEKVMDAYYATINC